ncbi:MAG: hypothetical protein Q4F57_02025 [Weeksellaceae bacterium]|nr:hypothetical protein [Weeksellaceae bacterium]
MQRQSAELYSRRALLTYLGAILAMVFLWRYGIFLLIILFTPLLTMAKKFGRNYTIVGDGVEVRSIFGTTRHIAPIIQVQEVQHSLWEQIVGALPERSYLLTTPTGTQQISPRHDLVHLPGTNQLYFKNRL